MKRLILATTVAMMAVPAISLAADTSDPGSPAHRCREQRTTLGDAAFKAMYGTNRTKSNAFGKCVSKVERTDTSTEAADHANAAKQCRTERDDATFASSHGDKTFAQYYGTNHNGSNAYGKCVSAKAKAQSNSDENDHQDATVNAAKSCKAARKADADAFRNKYGSRSNAFGKCVSAQVKKQEQEDEDQQTS